MWYLLASPCLALSLVTRAELFKLVPAAVAYEGIYGMEIVSAKDAVLDEEALASEPVKLALQELKKLSAGVKTLRASLDQDSQYDVAQALPQITKVRTTFNTLVAVFDKDTQKGTDRLERGILQDLVEVETNSKLPRSAKKLKLVNEKLLKLETTFSKLEAYFP